MFLGFLQTQSYQMGKLKYFLKLPQKTDGMVLQVCNDTVGKVHDKKDKRLKKMASQAGNVESLSPTDAELAIKYPYIPFSNTPAKGVLLSLAKIETLMEQPPPNPASPYDTAFEYIRFRLEFVCSFLVKSNCTAVLLSF